MATNFGDAFERDRRKQRCPVAEIDEIARAVEMDHDGLVPEWPADVRQDVVGAVAERPQQWHDHPDDVEADTAASSPLPGVQ